MYPALVRLNCGMEELMSGWTASVLLLPPMKQWISSLTRTRSGSDLHSAICSGVQIKSALKLREATKIVEGTSRTTKEQ